MTRIPVLPDSGRPLVFAHRGLSSIAPENTPAAFALARDMGIPGIELDVHLSADGGLPVIHDHSTSRVAGKALEVERSSMKELAALDVGSWKGEKWKGERILALRELFEEFGDSFYFDIELKNRVSSDYGLEGAVAACLRDAFSSKGELAGRILVSSFNPASLARFKYLAPAIPTAIIWSSDAGVPPYLRHGEGRWIGKVDALKPRFDKVRRLSSFRWKRFGRYPVIPWTVDDEAEAKRLLALGCDGVISNRPQDLGLPEPKASP
jgi:glycerophosphoryl diester phosphodiesterase